MLGKVQEAANGTEVLPEGAVLWAGILLPAEQFAQPALERERRSPGLICRVQSSGGWLDCSPVPSQGSIFFCQNCSYQPRKTLQQPDNSKKPTNAQESSCLLITLSPFLLNIFSMNLWVFCKRYLSKVTVIQFSEKKNSCCSATIFKNYPVG